jgi:hypothetical protein
MYEGVGSGPLHTDGILLAGEIAGFFYLSLIRFFVARTCCKYIMLVTEEIERVQHGLFVCSFSMIS